MPFNTGSTKRGDSGSDSLLSLLEQALQMPHIQPISHMSLPMSFDDPFSDQSMEPLPIRSNGPYPSLSVYSSSFTLSLKNTNFVSDNDDVFQHLANMRGPVDELIGLKRELQDIFTDEQDQAPPLHKRRRVSCDLSEMLHSGATSAVDETTARFRPHQEQQWRKQLKKVIEYKLENGHCCVPHSYPEDPVLARWVKRQRYQYKKFNDGDPTSTMTHRRIKELESIGFVWHSHSAVWMEKLNELKAFRLQTGHCNPFSLSKERSPINLGQVPTAPIQTLHHWSNLRHDAGAIRRVGVVGLCVSAPKATRRME